jgi:hypothetical protein
MPPFMSKWNGGPDEAPIGEVRKGAERLFGPSDLALGDHQGRAQQLRPRGTFAVARGLVLMPIHLFDPSQTLVHLDEAERHVREGELRLERQRVLIGKLRDGGHLTDTAETLLARFKDALASHISHRDRLRKEVRGEN